MAGAHVEALGRACGHAGQGPLAIRELARRLGRDVRAVHSDVHRLLKAGLVNRYEDGSVEFPYDEIHVDFVLKVA